MASWKDSCRAATIANITRSGTQTIDGVALTNERVLVKNQTTASENGIYVVAAGAWARAADMNTNGDTTLPGSQVSVAEGAENGSTTWELLTTGSITFGTTALAFAMRGSSVASIAALRHVVGDSAGVVNVRCFSSLADGGGGEFYWDAASTATDDGGTIIAPSGIATGRWKRQYSGPIKIEWFGPSTSNLSTAVNAAIQALPVSGGTIDLRGLKGIYSATATIVADRPLDIVLGKAAEVDFTLTDGIEIRDTFSMVGNDRAKSFLKGASNKSLFKVLGKTILGATGNGVSPIVLNIANHGYVTGDVLAIGGAMGNTNINTINTLATITYVDASHVSLDSTTGNGTFVGPFTPGLANPDDFGNASWTKVGASVVTNATTDPFGTSLADSIVESNTSGLHYIFENMSGVTTGGRVTLSIYAKAGSRSWIFFCGNSSGAGTYVNLSTGCFGTLVGGPTVTRSILSVGNFWYKITITYTASSADVQVLMATGDGGISYVGNGSSNVYLVRAEAAAVPATVAKSATGQPNIEIRNLRCKGAGVVSQGLDTSGLYPGQFSEGRCIIENNIFETFGLYGIDLATSFYFSRVSDNTFTANGTGLRIGDSANAHSRQNHYKAQTSHQLIVIGFSAKSIADEFEGSTTYPNAYDICFQPIADASGGSLGLVHGCTFFGENESLNPHRARIGVEYDSGCPSFAHASVGVQVLGCLSIGMTQLGISMASVDAMSHLVTYTTASAHGIPMNEVANVHILSGNNPTYNGKFNVTATDATHFTVTCQRTTGTYSSGAIVVPGDTNAFLRCRNPAVKFLVDHNTITNIGTVIDDGYTDVPSVSVQGSGKSIFGGGNIIAGPFNFAARMFSGSGKGWERVDPPGGVDFTRLEPHPPFAPTKIENQILYTETWSNAVWVLSSGVTKTAGQTYTAAIATDLLTATAHKLLAGDAVVFSNSGGAPPGGLVAGVTYYVIATGLTANDFKVSDIPGGNRVDITGTGSGTNTVSPADPYGGGAAVIVATSGSGGAQAISQDYVAKGGGTAIIEFWGKACSDVDGSDNSSLLIGIYDTVSNAFQEGTDRVRFGTTWKKHRIVITGLNVAHVQRLSFNAAGNMEIPGRFMLAFPQISDVPSEYVTTTNSAISTQAFARLKQPKQSVSGLWMDLTSTGALRNLLAALSTAGLLTDATTAPGTPTISSSTGFGSSPTVSMDSGSTDQGGSITVHVGTSPATSGTVVVAFGTPYTFPQAPIVEVTLANSNNPWPVGVAPPIVTAISDTGFTIVWRAAAVAGEFYAWNWSVRGR